MPQYQICDYGSSYRKYSIVGASGFVGSAYIYITYNLTLYITLTFNCPYFLDTGLPTATYPSRIKVSVWNQNMGSQVGAGGG